MQYVIINKQMCRNVFYVVNINNHSFNFPIFIAALEVKLKSGTNTINWWDLKIWVKWWKWKKIRANFKADARANLPAAQIVIFILNVLGNNRKMEDKCYLLLMFYILSWRQLAIQWGNNSNILYHLQLPQSL